jgi:DNA-binding response OmpR family regulator
MTTDAARASGRGRYVVIVEDSVLASDALRILFSEHGYLVAVAASVADAVTACEREPVDVLLLDLTLPDGDGLEVLAQLDAHGKPRPRRTLALTGHGDESAARRCLEAGCERVLLKPVSIRELLRLVENG